MTRSPGWDAGRPRQCTWCALRGGGGEWAVSKWEVVRKSTEMECISSCREWSEECGANFCNESIACDVEIPESRSGWGLVSTLASTTLSFHSSRRASAHPLSHRSPFLLLPEAYCISDTSASLASP
jgi:hypothetical protein